MINLSETDDIDAFYLCYKNAKATLHVIDQFFSYYPNGTIYLHSDNGCYYHNLKNKYKNIIYTYHNFNVNPFKMNYDRSLEWAKRLYNTTKLSDKKYLLLLEDDVWVRDRVKINSIHNMVGTNLGAFFNNHIFAYLRNYEKLKTMKQIYSGCGGCIFEKDIIKNQKFHNITKMINYYCSRYALWGDQLLTLIIYLNDGTIGRSEYYNTKILHNKKCKYFYDKPLDKKDLELVYCHSYENAYEYTLYN